MEYRILIYKLKKVKAFFEWNPFLYIPIVQESKFYGSYKGKQWWREKGKQMANKQSQFHQLAFYHDYVEQWMHAFCHSLSHDTVWLNGKSSCHLSWTE